MTHRIRIPRVDSNGTYQVGPRTSSTRTEPAGVLLIWEERTWESCLFWEKLEYFRRDAFLNCKHLSSRWTNLLCWATFYELISTANLLWIVIFIHFSLFPQQTTSRVALQDLTHVSHPLDVTRCLDLLLPDQGQDLENGRNFKHSGAKKRDTVPYKAVLGVGFLLYKPYISENLHFSDTWNLSWKSWSIQTLTRCLRYIVGIVAQREAVHTMILVVLAPRPFHMVHFGQKILHGWAKPRLHSNVERPTCCSTWNTWATLVSNRAALNYLSIPFL